MDQKEAKEYNPFGKDIMEYFQNLNWDVVDNEEYKECMTSFLPTSKDSPIESHALKLIHSGKYAFPTQKYDLDKIEKKTEETMEMYIPGVPHNTMLFPQNSLLTHKEQRSLYHILCKINFNCGEPLKESDVVTYQSLLSKAGPEYIQFQQFVQSMWNQPQNYQQCFEIPASVLEYINELWIKQVRQCFALYPPLYKKKGYIPLTLSDPNNDHSVMDFVKIIMCRGSPPKMTVPSLKTRRELSTDLTELCCIKPVSEEIDNSSYQYPSPQVSVDPQVDMCLTKENVDVVITCGAVKTIIDIYNVQKEWVLPFQVKNVLTINGDTNKKVVVIDKQLPDKAMSIYDKNLRHAKLVSKWALIVKDNPPRINKKQHKKPTASSCNERELIRYDDDDLFGDIVNTPGTSRNIPTTSSKSEADWSWASRLPSTYLSSEDSTDNEADVTSENTSKNVTTNNRTLKSKMKTSLPPQPADTSLDDRLSESAQQINTFKNKCVYYKLWNLHKSKHFNMSKQEQRSLKILVRSKIDGNLVHFKNNKRTTSKVCVTSKLEYQPEYGASKMSKSELVREYVDLVIRQSDLCRVRTVGHTKEVMLYEVKDLGQIKESLKKNHQMETNRLFDPLYAVLTKLIDLPIGHYMLHHTPKMGTFADLLLETQQNGCFDLSTYCMRLQEKDSSVPATQIDPFTLTRLHLVNKIPPALFKPVHDNYYKTRTFFGKTNLDPSKKKRNKKRRQKKRRKQ